MEVYALLVSVISLMVSCVVVYLAYLKPADIEMIVGKVISFYPLPEQTGKGIEWGGVAFYIPLTFHNTSSKGAVVEEVRIILEHKGLPNTNFDMSWFAFTQMHPEELRWVNKSVAQPIAVSGKQAVNEVVLFAWRKQSGQVLSIEPGEYEIKVLAWVVGDTKPSLKFSSSFIVSQEMSATHKEFMAKKHPMTVDVPLGESARLNTVISRAQVKELYRV